MAYLSVDCADNHGSVVASTGSLKLLSNLKIPLKCLLPKRCTLEELFNKAGRQLSQSDLVACLGSLLENGLIEIRVGDNPWSSDNRSNHG